MESLFQDLKFGARMLRKNPGFTAIAVLTLALGIGANTAMFSVVNSVLLRPLPFAESERIVSVLTMYSRGGTPQPSSLSFPDFEDYRRQNHTLEDIAAYIGNDLTLTGSGEALHIRAENVSSGLLKILRSQPMLGRDFRPEEDQAGHHVAILSHAFWMRQFHGDPNVIGRSLDLTGKQYTVIGVMPEGFQFPVRAEPIDLWITFSEMAEKSSPDDQPATEQRGAHFLSAVGRLRAGVTKEQAQSDLSNIAAHLAKEFPDSNKYEVAARVLPYLQRLVGNTKRPLFILLLAVGCVLLIACANVANLVLSRNTSRFREIAIRAALGVTRKRMVRQLLTESALLSCFGAMLGLALASWGLKLLVQFYPQNLPRMQQVGIDGGVFLYTLALAVITTVLFGLVPAIRVSSPDLGVAMRESGRGAAGHSRHTRLRSGLVVAETAIGVMLLIAAGLLLRSLDRLSHVDLGFDPGNIAVASIDVSGSRYNSDQRARLYDELQRRLSAIPGVVSATESLQVPLHSDDWTISFNILERPLPQSEQPAAGFFVVSRGFFETFKIPLVQGRTFDERDQRDAAPVMIINQEFAKRFFPNEDPIGKVVEIGAGDGPARKRWKTREIVGVVGNTRKSNLSDPPVPDYYVPLSQMVIGSPQILLRTSGDPSSVMPAVRQIVTQMDATVPVFEVNTLEDYLALDLGRARFQALLLSFFACIALLLTSIGLYGVMSYAVVQRTREIGIRMALGASRPNVLGLVVFRGVVLALMGILIGLGGALVLARFIAALLYEIPPRDPLTYSGVVLVLGIVSVLASYLPALRASKVDPMEALRYE